MWTGRARGGHGSWGWVRGCGRPDAQVVSCAGRRMRQGPGIAHCAPVPRLRDRPIRAAFPLRAPFWERRPDGALRDPKPWCCAAFWVRSGGASGRGTGAARSRASAAGMGIPICRGHEKEMAFKKHMQGVPRPAGSLPWSPSVVSSVALIHRWHPLSCCGGCGCYRVGAGVMREAGGRGRKGCCPFLPCGYPAEALMSRVGLEAIMRKDPQRGG